MNDPVLIGTLGFVALFALIALHVPIGVAMGLVGFGAYTVIAGFGPAVSLFGAEAATALGSTSLAVIPLFLLMGNFAGRAGMSGDLYRLASAVCGHWRGGLAYSTVLACAGFGAVSGSSVATAATMTSVALPEMRRRGYGAALSTGCVAAGRHARDHDSAVDHPGALRGSHRAVRDHAVCCRHRSRRHRRGADVDGHCRDRAHRQQGRPRQRQGDSCGVAGCRRHERAGGAACNGNDPAASRVRRVHRRRGRRRRDDGDRRSRDLAQETPAQGADGGAGRARPPPRACST